MQRCAQRGVSRDALQLLLMKSDREVAVGDGVTALSLSAGQARRLSKRDCDADTTRRASRLAVLVNREGSVLTVLRQKRGAAGRRYRGRV